MLDADLRELLASLTYHRLELGVVSGHAVVSHGYPRFTEDLDLFVHADPENAGRVMSALTAFSFGQIGLAPDDCMADDRMIQLGRAPNRVDVLRRLRWRRRRTPERWCQRRSARSWSSSREG